MTKDDSESVRPLDFYLKNAEKLHEAHPDTFEIPEREERDSLRVGDIAKLVFVLTSPEEGDPGAERMWVKVTNRQGANYVGELDNDPCALLGAEAGNFIEFGPEHIIDIYCD